MLTNCFLDLNKTLLMQNSIDLIKEEACILLKSFKLYTDEFFIEGKVLVS